MRHTFTKSDLARSIERYDELYVKPAQIAYTARELGITYEQAIPIVEAARAAKDDDPAEMPQ